MEPEENKENKRKYQVLEDKIGFTEIKEYLLSKAVSLSGKEKVNRLRFSTDKEMISRWLAQTAEMQFILAQSALPKDHFYDLSNFLRKALIEDAVLESQELRAICDLLFTAQSIKRRFIETEEVPLLNTLTKYQELPKPLMRSLDQKLDERGGVRPTASPALALLRKEKEKTERRLRSDMDRYLKMAVANGFAEKGANLSIRDGRMVIPMLAEHKRKIKGLVHDESATGHLVYLEPTEVLEVHNKIRSITYEEQREIRRILMGLTSEVAPYVKDIEKWQNTLSIVDFIRAKAVLSNDLKSTSPVFIEGDAQLNWKNAKHPLLLFSHRESEKKVVPLNISLNKDQRIIILSGPNAGGKSITLKTLGLLQYMIQCGIPVPMDEGSSTMVFDKFFVDIGDQQSIQDDLSTYSSHLSNMKKALSHTTDKSLILFDEFGTGTDPAYGGAIAESILEDLIARGVFGLVNTHYSNLKDFGEKQSKVSNARLLYDQEILQPLYQLEIGKPGSSYALEIAQKIGLSKKVIKRSADKVGKGKVNYDKALAALDEQKHKLSVQNQSLKERIEQLEKDQRLYETLNKELQRQRKTLLNEAKLEAKRIVESANKKIEKVIREIKEKNAEKEDTQNIRQNLERYKDQALKLDEIDRNKGKKIKKGSEKYKLF